jgi:hypothetical protein
VSDSVHLSIRIPRRLHEAIAHQAQESGSTFSDELRRRLGVGSETVDLIGDLGQRLEVVESDLAELKEMARGY